MKRFLLLVSAVVSLTTALILVVNAGLPGRATFIGQSLSSERAIAAELNSLAPPFEHALLSGDSVSLQELRGSPVIINFWATWCEPCRLEMPILQSTYNEYSAQGLRVLAVNLGESEGVVRDWVEEMRLTIDIVLDAKQEIETLYLLRGVPSTYVLAPNGVITHIFYGPTSESQLREAISPYIS